VPPTGRINRKPAHKEAWEIQFAEFQPQGHRVKNKRAPLEVRHSC
jgi:hypothetical protein